MKIRLLIPTLIPAVLAAGCAEPPAPGTPEGASEPAAEMQQTEHLGLPPIAALADAWNTIHPEGDTTCLYGTEYGFFVRPKSLSQVLITFPGGGACWSGQTCSDEPQGRVDDNPKTVKAEDNPAGSAGVFAEDNPDNPFREFTKVHVGYCTGDMHIGDAVRSNEEWIGEGDPPQRSPALQRLPKRHDRAGLGIRQFSSAGYRGRRGDIPPGSYGTPFHTSLVADHYPDAAVRHVADGNGALFIGERMRPVGRSVGYGRHPEATSRFLRHCCRNPELRRHYDRGREASSGDRLYSNDHRPRSNAIGK